MAGSLQRGGDWKGREALGQERAETNPQPLIPG